MDDSAAFATSPALVLIYRVVMDDTQTAGDGWGSVAPPAMR